MYLGIDGSIHGWDDLDIDRGSDAGFVSKIDLNFQGSYYEHILYDLKQGALKNAIPNT